MSCLLYSVITFPVTQSGPRLQEQDIFNVGYLENNAIFGHIYCQDSKIRV